MKAAPELDVAAIDIGGTKISAALITKEGHLLRRDAAETPATDGPEAILDAAAALVGDFGPVKAVGVGSAGVIDPVTGAVRSATCALRGWAGTGLRDEIQRRLAAPVAVDNDVHMHAVGEHWKGAAQGQQTVLVVIVGTGIGASLLVDGAVHHGAHAAAGHLGHLPAATASGMPCPCGATGHVEAVASGPAIAAEYAARTMTAATDLAKVSDAANHGDQTAHNVIVAGARALGSVLGGVANLLDPDMVVIGGGVTGCGPRWSSALHDAVAAELLPALAELPIIASALGGDAALIGAGRRAWELVG